MSGVEPLPAITKGCCALRFAVRAWKIYQGKLPDDDTFTCVACGITYRKSGGGWAQMSNADVLKEVAGHHER